jgi:transketolase
MNKILRLKQIAKSLRKEILRMSYTAKKAHISSCLSIVDILTYLYWEEMKIKPKVLNWKERDRFILSKGHAAPALFATLAYRGFFPRKLLETYGKNDSTMGMHPEFELVPGIEVSTGALGHGLSIGAGMALADKIDNIKRRVFVLVSDAECDEGTTWEAILFAPQHKLNNLFLLIDYNKLQAFGTTKEVINLEPLKDKLISFAWNVFEVDGNDLNKLDKMFKKIGNLKSDKPNAIILNTVAGKGVSFMENKLEWHYQNLDENLYKQAIQELNKK